MTLSIKSAIAITLCALTLSIYPQARAQDAAPAPTAASEPAGESTNESPPAAADATTNKEATGTDTTSTLKTVIYKLKSDIKRCAGLQDRTVRITCYDDMAGELGYLDADKTKKEQEVLSTIGFWQIEKSTSALGEPRTTLRSESLNTITSISGTERRVHFIIQCTPGKTEAFLDWKTPVTKSIQSTMKNGLDVTYRIDSGDRVGEKWQVSTDRQAIFVPDAIEFVRNMNNKQRLNLEVAPINAPLQGVQFDIKGIEQAAQELAKACY